MDVRLTTEQQQLRDAAAKLADDLGPGSVAELDDDGRITRLDKQIAVTGWRSLRSDEASGVEVAIVAEEFGRGLVDAPFLGPVLADDLARRLDGVDAATATVAIDGRAVDARGSTRALALDGATVLGADLAGTVANADLTRARAEVGAAESVGSITDEEAQRWYALALVVTAADLVGVSRGALNLAVEYAKIREQYGNTIGSYQAVAHLLAESLTLTEGAVSVLRHAAWAVDELPAAEAVRAAKVAKLYCARSARTVCETSIQVHGGIGNTWECLAHVYLRRALTSTELWPVKWEDIDLGLS
ncbi:acyl-CoA dehydrogenase [Mycolicibacterium chitae]|uniref:Acyl-CoA dehydrogenase domain-containing protein n=1 Tax=Mycolicibacterium chitae TaxID=1792 RepID=A0A3S5EI79_MYCCI|nr:acyl-CoA dehydrogenase family protein [Mycolicibacterium chitae]MCV7104880.1 acyl-CoA dehydrogenase [Mycolicibacterium chitae]BBZ03417.1 acyl-CoA dehydrogenase [Mycolicibacterium chitae]VEG46938.1 acyl-CoA dehydrogenase domain-containing protein [Mycolicibacterium chitae]